MRMFINNTYLYFFFGLAFFSTSVHAYPQKNNSCEKPIYAINPVGNPTDIWETDHSYEVFRFRDKNQPVRYIVSGDIVVLNKKNFPSLVRPVGNELTNFSELSIDARHIIVDMPLRIRNASLTLRGENIIFTYKGSIKLSKKLAKKSQYVRIVTKTLNLTNSRKFPFEFVTRDWHIDQKNPSYWGEGNSSRRILFIRAGRLIPGKNDKKTVLGALERGDPQRYFFKKSADAISGRGKGKFKWRENYDVKLGKDGFEYYANLFSKELTWPSATIAKMDRMFSHAPYDPNVTSFISNKIKVLEPRLLLRNQTSEIARIDKLKEFIATGRDQFGYTPYQVPMRKLKLLLGEFRNHLSVVFGANGKGGLLKSWDDTLLVTSQGGEIDKNAIETIKERSENLKKHQDKVSARIADLSITLKNVSNDISIKFEEAKSRETFLKTQWEEKKENIEQIGKVTSTLKTAGEIASVIYPPAAPAVIGATQVIDASGKLAIEHNSGNKINTTLVIQTIEGAQKEFEERKKRVDEMGKAWDSVRSSWKKGKEGFPGAWKDLKDLNINGQGFITFKKGFKDFDNKRKELQKFVTLTSPNVALQIPEFVEKDSQLQNTLNSIEGLRQIEGRLTTQISELKNEYTNITATLVTQRAILGELQTLDLKNDREIKQQKELATLQRKQILSDLAKRAALIQRAAVYLTGRQPSPENLNPEIINFAGEQIIRTGNGLALGSSSSLKKDLQEYRTEAYRYYLTLLDYMTTELETFKQQVGPSSIFLRNFFASDANKDGTDAYRKKIKLFLDTVNLRLKALFSETDQRIINALRSKPILIPWGMTATPITANRPEFLLGAVIKQVIFANEVDGKEISIWIGHPRNGIVYYGTNEQKCYLVEDVYKTVDSQLARFGQTTAPFDVDKKRDSIKQLRTRNYFEQLKEWSYPMRSNYYLLVEIPNKNAWSKAPKIKRIDIGFVGIH